MTNFKYLLFNSTIMRFQRFCLIILVFSFNSLFSQTFTVKLQSKTYKGGVNISCNGSSDGEISVTSNNLDGIVSWLWSDGNTSHQRDNLLAGTYWVRATDLFGNAASDTITLLEPPVIAAQDQKLSYTGGYNISRAGENNGQISVSAQGGIAPYQVYWADSSVGNTKLNLAAGTYNYIIKDANNCIVAKAVSLTGPPPLEIETSIINPLKCSNSSDGSASIQITGGAPPYKIQWSSGETDSIATRLTGERSYVRVIDSQDAEIIKNIEITTPEPIKDITIVSQYPGNYNVSCTDCFNGSIELQISGGTLPYTVIWSDTDYVANPFLRNNLGGKFYHYTIEDSNGCSTRNYVELTEPKTKGWQLNGNTEVDPDVQYLGTNDSSSFVIKTNSALALKINGEGNLGVGIEPTLAKLSINGDVLGNAGLKLPFLSTYNDTASSSLQNFRLIAIDENGNISRLGNNFPVQGLLPQEQRCKLTQQNEYLAQWAYVTGSPSLATIGTEDCRPYVGIGTISPQTRFDVNGNSFIRGGLQVGGSSFSLPENWDAGIQLNRATLIQSVNETSLSILNSFNSDGQTAVKIEVNRDKTKAISLQNNNGNETFLVYGDGKIEIGEAINSFNGNCFLKVNGGAIFGSENDYGNLNTSLVKVNGMIAARRFKVTLNQFPDYVFDDDYKLFSLTYVEEFVRKNKHLPGMPSELEVIANGGFDLEQIQLINVEKTEELFLHIIQLEKRIKELEESIRK